MCGPIRAADAVNGVADRGDHLAVTGVGIGASVVHLPSAMSYLWTALSTRVGSSPPTTTIRPSMNAAP